MRIALMGLVLVFGIGAVVGCTSQPSSPPADKGGDKSKNLNAKAAAPKHEGWWCDEHGLPEEKCWACSDKFCQECKGKGDWCDKHERPKSQCFKCDPTLKEKWAKEYEAKYGKKPPAPEEY